MIYHRLEFYRGQGKCKKQQWRWRFLFHNGKRKEVIACSSEGYTRRIDCKKSWLAVRKAMFKAFVKDKYVQI